MKKLIPALCLLLATVVMMGTSTYAWFAMNTSVSADGMSVSAKTDDAFLVISAGTTLADDATASATGTMDVSLYPVTPGVTLTSTNVYAPASWSVGSSDDPTDASTDSALTALGASADITKYVAKQSFTVGILPNSGAVNHDLRMEGITIPENKGIKVVVVCGTNIYTYSASSTTLTDTLAAKTLVTTSGVEVDVYVYIDGKDANVKTSNATNLTGAVSMTFTIDDVPST